VSTFRVTPQFQNGSTFQNMPSIYATYIVIDETTLKTAMTIKWALELQPAKITQAAAHF